MKKFAVMFTAPCEVSDLRLALALVGATNLNIKLLKSSVVMPIPPLPKHSREEGSLKDLGIKKMQEMANAQRWAELTARPTKLVFENNAYGMPKINIGASCRALNVTQETIKKGKWPQYSDELRLKLAILRRASILEGSSING